MNEQMIILQQWQTCVEMANAISQRRDTTNNIFITLDLALITAVSVFWNLKSLILLLSGVIFSAVWMILIRNFQVLNEQKYNVINALEEKLPTQPFEDEWHQLTENGKYKKCTKVEKTLPIIFIVLFLVLIIILTCELLLRKGG